MEEGQEVKRAHKNTRRETHGNAAIYTLLHAYMITCENKGTDESTHRVTITITVTLVRTHTNAERI